MKLKEESEIAGLKLNIQKTKFMGSSPIILWQIDGETVEIVDIFLGSKSLQMVTADLKLWHLLLMTNLDSILKSRDITLLTKVHMVKL